MAQRAGSGKGIAAFCRDEAIWQGNFYAWRTKLCGSAIDVPASLPPVTFIDLGAVNSTVASRTAQHSPLQMPQAMPSLDLRIDLGGVLVLTIARR